MKDSKNMTLKKINKRKKREINKNSQNQTIKYLYFILNHSFCCKIEISCLPSFN